MDEFVIDHPSIQLVKMDVESEGAGKHLEDAFGVDRSCWGNHNCNGRVGVNVAKDRI